MSKVNTLLRRLTPGKIIAAGAAALTLGAVFLILGVNPLVLSLLLPFGESVAAAGTLVVSLGGGLFLGNRVGTIFGRAYYDRKFDDELHAATVEYEKARQDG